MKTYESGNEWHFLNSKHAREQGGFNYKHRFGFNFSLLSKAQQKRYVYIYMQTMIARGVDPNRLLKRNLRTEF